MTDRLDFEHRLAERLGAHTAGVVRPFDAGSIAAAASRHAGTVRRRRFRIGRATGRPVAPMLIWVALAALLLALVGATLMTGSPRPLPAVIPMSPSPSASTPPSTIAILPGEPWLVYPTPSDVRTGGGLILVREDGTDRHEILARPNVRLDHPDWSPDGSRLAYETWTPDVSNPALDRVELWVSDVDGSNARQVTTCSSTCFQRAWPAWSPDGTRLALVRYDRLADGTWGPSALEILDLATGDIRVVTETTDGATVYYTPRWSPDGTRLVAGVETFTDATETTLVSAVLAVFEADGSDAAAPQVLTPPGLVARYPDWHPIDDRIVFQASTTDPEASTTDLYVIRADGTGLANLTNLGSGAGASMPTWTPDGRRIAYSQQAGSPIKTAAFIDADGSNATSVSSDLAAVPRLRPTP